jgi:copper homeostasis protein
MNQGNKPIKKLEVACFHREDAQFALEFGADRIEFCEDYQCGGISPKLDDFIDLRNQFPEANMHVMIRPRAGDFVYSSYNIDLMCSQIDAFANEGADGFVLGVLNVDNTVDVESCRKLLTATKNTLGKKFVFHRAFDLVPNHEEAISTLIDAGFSGILSSGGKNSAKEGCANLKVWEEKFGQVIEFIAGGGVRADNAEQIMATSVNWLHSACYNFDTNRLNLQELKSLLEHIRKMK